MAADDDLAQRRLEELEAEVKAEADVARRRKTEAEARVREKRAAAQAEKDELRARQAAIVKRQARPRAEIDVGDAFALARKAADAKQELSKPREKGDKSWLISGGLSLLLGPMGWLYAGSWREAVPASLLYLIVASVAAKIIPMFLLMPVLMVLLPLSGIAGVVYAIGHNRHGHRIRLFGEDAAGDKDKRLGLLGKGKPKRDED